MSSAGINYLAVLVAAAASFALGAAWYGALAKQWMAAAKVTEADLAMEGFAAKLPFLVAALCQLVMAFMLAGVLGHLGRVDFAGGLITALALWAGFVVTSMTVNHRFQNRTWAMTGIDGGYWLAAMLLQGAVIGGFGV